MATNLLELFNLSLSNIADVKLLIFPPHNTYNIYLSVLFIYWYKIHYHLTKIKILYGRFFNLRKLTFGFALR